MNPADPSDFVAVHRCLRAAVPAVAAAARHLDPTDRRRAAAVGAYGRGVVGELHLHHTVEDETFFPALRRAVPAVEDHLDRLDRDHAEIGELTADLHPALRALGRSGRLDRPATAAADGLERLDEVLRTHLDVEDELIVPLFARHLDADDYRALTRAALRSGSLRQASFTVPFLLDQATPGDRDHLLDLGGVPLRLLWTFTRGRYRRLAAATFARGTTTGAFGSTR